MAWWKHWISCRIHRARARFAVVNLSVTSSDKQVLQLGPTANSTKDNVSDYYPVNNDRLGAILQNTGSCARVTVTVALSCNGSCVGDEVSFLAHLPKHANALTQYITRTHATTLDLGNRCPAALRLSLRRIT